MVAVGKADPIATPKMIVAQYKVAIPAAIQIRTGIAPGMTSRTGLLMLRATMSDRSTCGEMPGVES